MCISAGHKSTKNIIERKAFTVSMADLEHTAACDYVGLVSAGNTPDKFEKAGFHTVKSKFVDAPLIEELPIAAECRLKSYDAGTGRMVGEIVNVCVDERVLDENGNVDVSKAQPITFDPFNNTYVVLGETVARASRRGQHRCCPRRDGRKSVQRRQLAQIKIYAKRPARFRAGHFVFRM